MTGRFDKYKGEVTLHVDDQDWIVTPTNKEVGAFLGMNEKNVSTEQKFARLSECMIGLFYKAYPDEPKEQIQAFVLQNIDTITTQFVIALGWSTQKEIDAKTDEEIAKGNLETKQVSG